MKTLVLNHVVFLNADFPQLNSTTTEMKGGTDLCDWEDYVKAKKETMVGRSIYISVLSSNYQWPVSPS